MFTVRGKIESLSLFGRVYPLPEMDMDHSLKDISEFLSLVGSVWVSGASGE